MAAFCQLSNEPLDIGTPPRYSPCTKFDWRRVASNSDALVPARPAHGKFCKNRRQTQQCALGCRHRHFALSPPW